MEGSSKWKECSVGSSEEKASDGLRLRACAQVEPRMGDRRLGWLRGHAGSKRPDRGETNEEEADGPSEAALSPQTTETKTFV